MTGWLLDTNVLSAFAQRPRGPSMLTPAIADWFRAETDRVFLPTIVVAEVQSGICKLRRQGGAARADVLAEWLEGVLVEFSDRILSLDTAVAMNLGTIGDSARANGRDPGLPDLTVAATAFSHGLTVLTRNGRHFALLGVAWADPFAALPPD